MRRIPTAEKFGFFYPGHMKFDYAYSIGKKKPDIIVQFWANIDEADPYVANRYKKLVAGNWSYHLRGESRAIFWDKIIREIKQ